MVFYPPAWSAPLAHIPDSIPLWEFGLNQDYGRAPHKSSRDPFTCGLTGKSFTSCEVQRRTMHLARSLAAELGWDINRGSEMDRVVCAFTYNTIDIMTLHWAISRCNGVSTPANTNYSVDELTHQLVHTGSQAIFTCAPLLETALKAARKADIPLHRIFMCELPKQVSGSAHTPSGFKTLHQLIQDGTRLPEVEPQKWSKGQGKRQVAFIVFSSGTTGLPKGVTISHYNVIANVLQWAAHHERYRESLGDHHKDIALGLLPQSHIYALVVNCCGGSYLGDQLIVLPKFDLRQYLSVITRFKIETLFLVPPIIVTMIEQKAVCNSYDLSSVRRVVVGAAPLGIETAHEIAQQYPAWAITQAYGLTEACTTACITSPHDIWIGSAGSLLPGFEARLVAADGTEITDYNVSGELWLKSPSNILGYLSNNKATQDAFSVDDDGGRWLLTGDEVMFRKSQSGNEHLWIVDRIKEMIKYKGHQIAPAELESFLLDHPSVSECAVIGVPNHRDGEVPKAFVVMSKEAAPRCSNSELERQLREYVEAGKPRQKWLRGGVEIIDEIPKSPSGKILRKELRARSKILPRL